MASDRAVASALVDWINSCPITPKISSLTELSDGSTVAKVLLDIDPNYFKMPPETHESSTKTGGTHWVLRFQKLKRLHKDLTQYYTEALGHRLPSQPPNLTAIAKNGSVDEAIKLMKIVVSAAVLSDRKEEYITMIQELSPSSQTELMNVINEMMTLDEGEGIVEDKPNDVVVNDMDQFRVEEEMARLVGDKETAEAENKNLKKRLKTLQEHFDQNQSHLVELQDQILSGDKSYAGRADPLLRSQLDELQSDVQKLEDIIAEKEATITTQERTIGSLNRKVDDLLPKAEAGMKYKDDLDVARHTIEKLRKTQNVAEKYRKKLEGMGELELQLKDLEEQNAQMFKDLRAGEENAKQLPRLKRTVEQYKKQVAKLEAECAELTRTKHSLETEKQILMSKTDGAEYQQSRDQERIRVLEEKLRELENGVISETAEEYGSNLDSELTYSTKTKTDMKLKINRLENEIHHLKEGGGAGADNVVLQHRLEDVTRAKDKLEQDFLEANTAKLVLESQLQLIHTGSANDGTDVVLKLRQNLLETEKQLAELKRKHGDSLAELDTAKRDLSTAQSDLSLVDKGKLEILAELKASANSEIAELQVKHTDLEQERRDLEVELDLKKGLLNKVLLEKDEIATKLSMQKDQILEREQALSDLKATIAAFEGTTEGRGAALEKRVTQLQSKLEDRREKMTKSKEYIKKQNAIIKELKEQLDSAITADADDRFRDLEERFAEHKRQKQEQLAMLERENLMISTAFHDQASRLQMNSVVILRRSDNPVSWLNKQRNTLDSSLKK